MEAQEQHSPENHSSPKSSKKKFLILALLTLVLAPAAFAAYYFFKPTLPFLPQKEKEFKIVEVSPDDQEIGISSITQPTIVFSKKINISENDLPKHFSISPKVPGKWKIEKNGQVVYFQTDKKPDFGFAKTFADDSIYTITVKKTVTSQNGEQIKEDKEISFRTAKHKDARFGLQKRMISATVDTKTSLSLYNVSPFDIKVSVFSSTEQDMVTYLKYKDKKSPLLTPPSNKGNPVLTFSANNFTPDQYSPSVYSTDINIPGIKNPGIYYVELANQYGKDDFFLVVSNHISHAFKDKEMQNAQVWATDAKTGKSLPNVDTTFYSLKNIPTVISKTKTDAKGLAKGEGKKDERVDLIITKNGSDIAVVSTSYYGEYILNPHNLEAFSYVDRPVYRPGDTIHYKAVIRARENNTYTYAKGKLYAKFAINGYDVATKIEDYQELEIDEFGTVTHDFKIPNNVAGSYPFITLHKKKEITDKEVDTEYEQISLAEVNVEPYRKPDMDVEAKTNEKEYVSQDTAHFSTTVKTLYGKPLSNVGFTYRVLVNNFSEIKNREYEDIDEESTGLYGYGRELARGEGTFDKKGNAQIEFSTDLKDFEDSQIATVEISPKIGASPSIGKIAKLIHRGDFAIFFDKVEGDSTNGIRGNIQTLNHSTKRQPVTNQKLTVELYDTSAYDKKVLKETKEFTTNEKGVTAFSFSNTPKGSYEIVAKGQDARSNTVTGRHTLYVDLSKNTQTSEGRYSFVASTNKESYKSGETATVTVTANFPIPDAVIIVSGNYGESYFYSSSIIQSVNKNSVGKTSFTIPIKIAHDQNQPVGVNILTTYENTALTAQTFVTVDNKDKDLKTNISFNKDRVKPGENITAEITTTDANGKAVSADVSLAVIDGAILQIGRFNENIWNQFYGSIAYPYISLYDSTQGIYDGPGGGGGCFLEGTAIRMANGTTKSIEHIDVGDRVLSRESEHSDKLIPDTVTKTFRHVVSEYLTINNHLNVTPVHRIYLNYKWQTAKDVKIGDVLLDENGQEVIINSIEHHSGTFLVYNFTTENTHTFFAGGIYVHNDKGAATRKNFADTAYWNPHIKTNQLGRASVSFKVPDNLTSFTAQSFANTQNLFGQATGEFASFRDVSIIPTVPNFYYQGDKIMLSALIQNSSAKNQKMKATVSIRELGFTKTQDIEIAKDDFDEIAIPTQLTTNNATLSFLFEIKDESGTILDSVLLKKDILPKGSVKTSWSSFEGEKSFTLSSTFKNLDINSVSLLVFPHVIWQLFTQGYSIGLDHNYLSSRNGEELYTTAYILAQTKDGTLIPSLFGYARLKNEFRNGVQELYENRSSAPDDTGTFWTASYDSTKLTTAFIIKALEEAKNTGLLDDFTDITPVINSGKKFLSNPPTPITMTSVPKTQNPPRFQENTSTPSGTPEVLPSIVEPSGVLPTMTPYIPDTPPPMPPPTNDQFETPEEEVILDWVLSRKPKQHNQTYIESLAVRALSGDKDALSTLRSERLPSADDRYLWQGNSKYAQALASLAMMEYGSKDDQDKAAKAISLNSSMYQDGGSLYLLAGIKHLIKNNLVSDDDMTQIIINGDTIVNQTDYTVTNGLNVTQMYTFKNLPDNKLKIEIKKHGNTPLYTTVIQTDYSLGDEKNKISGTTSEKISASVLKREYRDLTNNQALPNLTPGTTAVVVLRGDNPYYSGSPRLGIDSLFAADAISPGVMYLNQSSENSPEYQSALNQLFPGGASEYIHGYLTPYTYTDQAAFFSGSLKDYPELNLPYVIYQISDGAYYQPKTSLIYKDTGLLLEEK